jgi:hypothetical protein
VTEGYQPPTSRSTNPDQDTTTLPRVSVPPGSAAGVGGPSHAAGGGWSQPSRTDASRTDASRTRNDVPVEDDNASGLGARLSSAASTVAATAASAATTAKTAMKSASAEAENRAARPPATGRGRASRQPRRARLTLSHINVYSVFKFSCVLAIALFFVWLIMVGVLYGILDISGVFDRINNAVHQISGDGKSNDVVTGSLVFGFAIIIGVVNIVLFIALSTVGAMVYNLCADLVGGAEVTLSERE